MSFNNKNITNHFAYSAQMVDVPRSRIPLSWCHRTSGSVGYLLPMSQPIEILPGDTGTGKTKFIARLHSPIVPCMDDCYIDTFWFYVRSRNLWDKFKQFCGESDVAGYDNTTSYSIPKIYVGAFTDGGDLNSNAVTPGSLLDRFGVPITYKSDNSLIINGYKDRHNPTGSSYVSALPVRAYRQIWNTFFRDQNLQSAVLVNTSSVTSEADANQILPVCKLHDYFTSCLPYPQKGPDVLLPYSSNDVPVITKSNTLKDYYGSSVDYSVIPGISFASNGLPSNSIDNYSLLGIPSYIESEGSVIESVENEGVGSTVRQVFESSSGSTTLYSNDHLTYYPTNLWATTSNLSSGTVVQLRQTFALQRMYEDRALFGSRFYEYLRGTFGINAAESVLGLPEYLGGSRQTVNLTQVTQSTPTSSDDNSNGTLGTAGAMSVTLSDNFAFEKSFDEPGYLIGLYCIRNKNSYEQGLHRLWTRSDFTDFYDPHFANIGEQPVYSYEIYLQGSEEDHNVFGYQERYGEYRYIPSISTGDFRLNSPNSVGIYCYSDFYSSSPTLSANWIKSDRSNVDRTIALNDDSDQFWIQFYHDFDFRRKMPAHGGHSLQGWY